MGARDPLSALYICSAQGSNCTLGFSTKDPKAGAIKELGKQCCATISRTISLPPRFCYGHRVYPTNGLIISTQKHKSILVPVHLENKTRASKCSKVWVDIVFSQPIAFQQHSTFEGQCLSQKIFTRVVIVSN